MARESDYDVDLFAEMVRAGKFPPEKEVFDLSPENGTGEKKKKVVRKRKPRIYGNRV